MVLVGQGLRGLGGLLFGCGIGGLLGLGRVLLAITLRTLALISCSLLVIIILIIIILALLLTLLIVIIIIVLVCLRSTLELFLLLVVGAVTVILLEEIVLILSLVFFELRAFFSGVDHTPITL